MRAARDRESDRGAPAQREFVAGRRCAARLLGIRRRRERRETLDAGLADLDRLVDPLQEIGTVRPPRDVTEFPLVEPLARRVEDRLRHQHLAAAREPADARGEVHREALDQRRLRRAGRRGALRHLAEVQAHAHRGQLGLLGVQLLESQRERDGRTRRLEREKKPSPAESISRPPASAASASTSRW